MPRVASAIMFSTVFLVAACEKHAPSNDLVAKASSGATVLAIQDSIADAIQSVAQAIDTTITLGKWMKAHPADKITEIAPSSGVDDPFCRAAVSEMSFLGRKVTRSAGFYLPEPPPGEMLPDDTARAANELCELRTMWVTTEPMDSASAKTFADTLRGHIGQELRPPEMMPRRPGRAAVIRSASRKLPGAMVVIENERVETDFVRGVSEGEPTPAAVPSRQWQAMLVAYAPGSGVQDFESWEIRYDRRASQRAEELKSSHSNADSAMAWANVPSITADLQIVLGYLRQVNEDAPDSVRPKGVDEALLRAVKTTHDIAPSLPPARRAAALLATDIVLFAAMPMLGPDTTKPLYRTLSSSGISFDYLPIGDMYQDSRPWLWQAYQLDSLGRAGREAFAELLGSGWTTSGACKDGVDQSSRVISRGEAALRAGSMDPRVHFFVAAAYKSVFDLAHYGPNEYNDPKAYKDQEESARSKAIEHYRAALKSLPAGFMRRQAWTNAMRVLLRRSGEQPEYWCFYD